MNRIRHRQRHALYAVGAILAVTGAAWAALHYLPDWLGVSERDAVAVNASLMKVHGAAAMLSLLLLGSLLAEHVRAGWRAARNRASGVIMLLLSCALIFTGYLLYYAGAEGTRQVASVLHLGAGALLPLVVLGHALRLMRVRRRRARNHVNREKAWKSTSGLPLQQR